MAFPLRRCRAVAIPLPSESLHPRPTSTIAPPSPATETAPAIAPTFPSERTPSSTSSSSAPSQDQPKTPKSAEEVTEPRNQLEVPPPFRLRYACGPRMCATCAKKWPPIGHRTSIPYSAVAAILRHAMPHRFHTLEYIKERQIAMGLLAPPKDWNISEGDDGDLEYPPPGEFQPPAWTSDKARPKKSCLRKRDSNRFTPYPSPSTRPPLVRRSATDIKASLKDAVANRMALNYEGPYATAIRNEISAIYVPGLEPFKWQPEYTGPPSETSDESDQPLSDTTSTTNAPANDLASSPRKDLMDKAAVVERTLPSPSKKRRHEEEEDDNETPVNSVSKAVEGSPPKKQRHLPTPAVSNPTKRTSRSPKRRLSSPPPSPSPIRSTSPSETLTTVPTDSSASSSDEERFSPASFESDSQDSSARKARIAKKKLRFQFTNPSSTHPKFGITDSLYLHYRRAKSQSQRLRQTKAFNTVVPATGDWTDSEIKVAASKKADWDKQRADSVRRLTSRERLKKRLYNCEKNDDVFERFDKLVDRYEAGWPEIDLAGVRARYIRPRKNEVSGKKNKEAMPLLLHPDAMRKHYPSWEHPAWLGVDENAIADWEKSPHFKLRVIDVMHILEGEESERRREDAQPEDATEIASVVDEEEARMRREYIEEQVASSTTTDDLKIVVED